MTITERTLAFSLLSLLLVAVSGCGSDAANAPASDLRTDAGPDQGRDAGTPDTGPRCEDEDHDGYGLGCELGEDCDDSDPYVHPGATERCDGNDDDCDGEPDPCGCAPWLGEEGCPEGQYCVAAGEELIPECVELPEGELAGSGEPCTGAGSCAPGLHCVRWSDDQSLCTHTCDPYTGDGCPQGEECLSYLARNRDVGLCREPPPACDVYEPVACDDGEACRPLFRRNGVVDTRCQPAGPQGPGEPCSGENGQCLPGLICVKQSGTGEALCHRVCRTDQDCREGEGHCVGRTMSLEITYCR